MSAVTRDSVEPLNAILQSSRDVLAGMAGPEMLKVSPRSQWGSNNIVIRVHGEDTGDDQGVATLVRPKNIM